MGSGRGLELDLLRICALVLSHSQRLLDSICRLWRGTYSGHVSIRFRVQSEQSVTTLSERNCRCGGTNRWRRTIARTHIPIMRK